MSGNSLIDIYIDRFINRHDVWGRQWVSWDGSNYGYAHQKPDMDSKGGKFHYEPVTPDLVLRHMGGEISCAWAAVSEQGKSRWLCFDSDTGDGSLGRLDNFLRSYGWKVVREGRRAGRDGHLWIFFDQPVPANQLIILGDAMMRHAEVTGLERFPKSATGYSQVRGPLGINLKPEANGSRGWFDGVQHDLKVQLEWLESQPLNRAEDAIKASEEQETIPRKMRNTGRRRSRAGTSKQVFAILDYIDTRPMGKELVAACPICELEGHDLHQDNLRIKPDGSAFCCVFGGPSQTHKNRDIIRLLVRGRRHAS